MTRRTSDAVPIRADNISCAVFERAPRVVASLGRSPVAVSITRSKAWILFFLVTGDFIAPNCVPYSKGGGWTSTKQVATLWSNGVDLTAYVGLSLKSQPGYSEQGSLDFDFYGRKGEFCGQYAFPGEDDKYVGSYIAR